VQKLTTPSSEARLRPDSSGESGTRPGVHCPLCGPLARSNVIRCASCNSSLIGRGKKTLFASILILLVLGTTEIVLRGYFATLLGPSVFWFGTSIQRLKIGGRAESSPLLFSLYQRRLRGSGDEYHNVRQHEFSAGNYTRYFPNEARYTYDADTREVYRATINTRGFRGSEIAEQKPAGTVRVVTLGA
jgi:hypothetical protein